MNFFFLGFIVGLIMLGSIIVKRFGLYTYRCTCNARGLIQNINMHSHVTVLFYRMSALNARNACAGHSSNTLATRVAFVGRFIICALYTVCLHSVCAKYTRSASATRYAFGANSPKPLPNSGKSWTHADALINFPFFG